MNISHRRVSIVNNDITYTWDSVPAIKYENWLKMTSPEKKEEFTVDGFPFFIQIEPTNYCNLKCPRCPAGGLGFERNKRHMKLEEFQSIIDDMEEYLLFITLWDWGEPLLNPDLPEMIRYASERDIKIVVSTNCNCHFFYDEAYMERLLRSGLTTLIVAVDSIRQDNYEKYRVKGNLNKSLEGIKRVVSLKKKIGVGPSITMRMVLMKQNEHELRDLRRLARALGTDRFSAKTVNPWYKTQDENIVPVNPRYRRYQYEKGTLQRVRIPFKCNIILRQCTIHAGGNVVPCCWHYNDDFTAGNVFTGGGLRKLWNDPSYQNLRKRVSLEKDSLPICSTCSFNYKPSRTGWFLQTVNLTQRRTDQFRYLLKRHIELNMNPKLLDGIIKTRDKMKALFRQTN
ncbi:MAG TPA: radical SAM protein [Thermodesulfovibrionales bacterium]|nr:radical SAM protein [Thermodesulfovibrionales bacterium]